MRSANYPLRLQPSLKAAAERLAAAEGTSLNQFINMAVAERISAIETEEFFRKRAATVSKGDFLSFLEDGDEPPREGDVIR